MTEKKLNDSPATNNKDEDSSVGVNLKNLLAMAPGLFPSKESPPVQEEFEAITEAMAERLAERTPKLLKGLDALQKNTKASQHHKIELQRWVDKENEELRNLKKTITDRKRSHLTTVSENDRSLLEKRHPVWARNFNLYLDQIQDLFGIHKDRSAIIQCILEPNTFRLLKIFYFASGENLLCINSRRNLKYEEKEMPVKYRAGNPLASPDENHMGEYIFRPIPGGHAQWTFTGIRWGIENHMLWLDFGNNQED